MVNVLSAERDLLFCSGELRGSLEVAVNSMRKEVEAFDENQLLNTVPEDLVRYLVEKYRVEPAVLRPDEWTADQSSIEVDVRHDIFRNIRDRGRPALVPGQRILVFIPFDGEAAVLKLRPSRHNMNPPQGTVRDMEVVFTFDFLDNQQGNLKQEIENRVREIQSHLAWSESDISAHNQSLPLIAMQAITARRTRLLGNRRRLTDLGIPIRTRSDAPKTFALPNVRKKAVPTLPSASSAPWEPEPALAMEHYDHALNVIQNMTHVMERSPNAFKGMSEEDLRQHFLVQLNGQFEGNATGETFNAGGKTDILLRENDRNAFIAECKFWTGPKGLKETIDQLLSYQSWRDTKTAILIFNRTVAMSTILSAIPEHIAKHSNYKRTWPYNHESGFRYVFHQNGDANRELIVTVLVFDVPCADV